MPLRVPMSIVLLSLAGAAPAADTLKFLYRPYPAAETQERTDTGRVVARDSAGNLFFETIDGARHLLAAADVISETADEEPFRPATPDEMGERLVSELGPGFRVHTTQHYVVAYDTSREYAEWSSSLLEGLHKALVRYWKREGIDLEEPTFPLPILIHRSAAAYNAASRAEGVPSGAIGYYHMGTNRVRMYDLTGSDVMRGAVARMRRGSRREITQMLSLPAAEPLVATIVHEATHQTCFNAGLMQRYADLPLWLVEGMAVYFEAPKAGSMRGWGGIGEVNARRLRTFHRHLPQWNNSSLTSLVASDNRLRNNRTAGAAYADAWALNYYLIKRHGRAYSTYVKSLSEREPFETAASADTDEARQRLELFTEHFGPIDELEKDFLRVMSRIEAR